MQERYSQVNFRKLVKDLADMYTDDPFDVVISELVANALDAKAEKISIDWNENSDVLIVEDDGEGMDASQFAEYHDFAAELKSRGSGIGFAGIGAKISFNVADRVITETRHDGKASGSDWRWHDDGSLRWKVIPSKRPTGNGTRVEVHFNHDQVPSAVDDEYLIRVLKRHYLPLFVTDFARSYSAIKLYPVCPRFTVNSSPVKHSSLSDAMSLAQRNDFRVGAVGWGAVGVSKHDFPIGGQSYGILLCTHGKVIKAELFGQSTGILGPKLFGIVEIPSLVEYLTANKSDLKGGPGRIKGLNRLLDPVREKLRKFLVNHGVAVVEQNRNQLSARLERELTKMVKSLPELQDFDGLLQRSRALRKSNDGSLNTSEVKTKASNSGGTTSQLNKTNNNGGSNGGSSRELDKGGKTRARRQRSRRNQGLRVAFEEHPDRGETAWIDSSTVVINSGHAAYQQRINQDQARLTYCMFSIGIALDKAELVPASDGVSYVDKFIAAWGQS